MARFRFRLERLLRVRELREELVRSTWLAAGAAARDAEEAAARDAGRVARAQSDVARLQERSPLQPLAVLAGDATLPKLMRCSSMAREHAEQLAADEERARAFWWAARSDARALAELEQRARRRQRAERDRREARAIEHSMTSRSTARTRARNAKESR